MKNIVLLFTILLLFTPSYSQIDSTRVTDANSSVLVTNPKPVDPADSDVGETFMTSMEFILSLSVLIFGLLIVGLEIYLIRTKEIGPDMLVKFIVVTLIITGTLFLITAGYNNNQIAPAVGLFGTVAGYLLGKSSSSSNSKTNNDETA